MSGKNNGGDKTEKPTPRRLRESRRKGDLAKSKDFSTAIAMIGWVVLLITAAGFLGVRLAAFMGASVARATESDFAATLSELGWNAFWLVLVAGAVTLLPAVVSGLAAEFFQTGALFTTEKLKPSFDKLNPVEGLKRMFSLDNLFELAKTLVKAGLILAIIVIVLAGTIDDYAELLHAAGWTPRPGTGPQVASAVFELSHSVTLQLFGWTAGVFLLVAFADRAWANHRHIKKLMMSRRDIRQEHKDSEGDPMLKSQRRQMHEEWANQNAIQSAGKANVLLTNPTHLAIALDYDPETCPIPVVAAKGEGPLAAAMRAAAEAEGVPIVRNVGLARTIWATSGPGEIVPETHFEAIAEIILWARRARGGETAPLREDAA